MQDPQSLHKYAYAHGDPTMSVDPSGWARECQTGNTIHCRVGRAAHIAIQQDYEDWGALNGKIVEAESTNSHFQNVLIPDLLNFSDARIGEIKPLSASGAAKGYAQVYAAIGIANGIETTYGGWTLSDGSPLPNLSGLNRKWTAENWGPGTAGIKAYWLGDVDASLSKEVVVTLGNWKGVLFYKWIKMRGKETPVLAMERAVETAKEAIRTLGSDRGRELTFNDGLILEHQLAIQALATNLLIAAGAVGVAYLGAQLGGMLAVASFNASMGFA